MARNVAGLSAEEVGTPRKDGKRYTRGFHRNGGKRLVLRATKTDKATGIVAGMDYALVASEVRNGQAEEGGMVTVAAGNMLEAPHILALRSCFTDAF